MAKVQTLVNSEHFLLTSTTTIGDFPHPAAGRPRELKWKWVGLKFGIGLDLGINYIFLPVLTPSHTNNQPCQLTRSCNSAEVAPVSSTHVTFLGGRSDLLSYLEPRHLCLLTLDFNVLNLLQTSLRLEP